MAELVQARSAGFGTVTDDDGSGTTGTVGSQAWLTGLLDDNDKFIQKAIAGLAEGRITLTAATPVTTADVTAATTIRFTPYKGFRLGLYDGARWRLYSFTEVTLALGADAATTVYDLFAFDSGGTVTLERLAWSSGTARATALVLQDGVLVKSGVTTRRYLGTYRTTGSAGQTEDSVAKRFVWNYYNRVRRDLRVLEGTDSWTYTTATLRQARATATNQVEAVIGVAEVLVDLAATSLATNTGSTNMYTAIGEDSTSAADAKALLQPGMASSLYGCAQCLLRKMPAIGYHFWAWLEASNASGTTTFYGDNASALGVQSGLIGSIDG